APQERRTLFHQTRLLICHGDLESLTHRYRDYSSQPASLTRIPATGDVDERGALIEHVGHVEADLEPVQDAILQFVRYTEVERIPATPLQHRGCERVRVAADVIERRVH